MLADPANGEKPQVLLLATGSEVSLAVDAQKELANKGISARVVSMPSWSRFELQSQEYKDSVILPEVKARVGIEMATPLGWERYVGDQGSVIGNPRFWCIRSRDIVMKEYGFTVENVLKHVEKVLK